MESEFHKRHKPSGWLTFTILLPFLACAHSLHAQEAPPRDLLPRYESAAGHSDSLDASTGKVLHLDLPDRRQIQLRTLGIIFGSAAAVGLYGQRNWWQDGFEGRFKQEKEGWFGRNTYSGGADKLGHFFMGYAGTRLSSLAFEWAGNTSEDALKLGALTTFGILGGVEVLDGFSRNWSFSREDAIVGALGVGTGLLLEHHPNLDRVLDIRLLYWPSRESGRDFNPFGDYSGQTYLLVAKASGMPAFREHPVLRYLEVAVGYGTRGYSDSPRDAPADGHRHFYFGVSLNVSEVLRQTVFRSRESDSTLVRATGHFLEYVQIPGTAALVRRDLSRD